jgi:putative ABC transport system ATP-binding protein
MLELQNVHKAYQEAGRRQPVLSDLSARFEAAESIALLGPSGSGKSTLLNLLSGLDVPDAGRVEFAGQDLARWNDDARTLWRRRHVGFVFQFFNLLPALSVLDNLTLPQNLLGVGAKLARQRAQQMLDAVGLSARAGSYADTLSGGEQQRIAVARAIVHQPDIVLADEPTGNLDAATAGVVLELLQTLVVQRGRLLIMATHSATAAAICTRACAIEGGQLQRLDITQSQAVLTK